MTTYRIDKKHLTVLATDEHGETCDLNSGGAPCLDLADLAELIRELHDQGAFDRDECRRLLEGIS